MLLAIKSRFETQASLAKRIGVSRGSIWRWLTDNQKYAGTPNAINRELIQKIYDEEFGQRFIPLKWKWIYDQGGITYQQYQDLQIPIDIWRRGIDPISGDGIAGWVTEQFAKDWAKDKENPSTAEADYISKHYAGFASALTTAIRDAYQRKKVRQP